MAQGQKMIDEDDDIDDLEWEDWEDEYVDVDDLDDEIDLDDPNEEEEADCVEYMNELKEKGWSMYIDVEHSDPTGVADPEKFTITCRNGKKKVVGEDQLMWKAYRKAWMQIKDPRLPDHLRLEE